MLRSWDKKTALLAFVFFCTAQCARAEGNHDGKSLSDPHVPKLAAEKQATVLVAGEVETGPSSEFMVKVDFAPYPPDKRVGSFSAVFRYVHKGIQFDRGEKSFFLDKVKGAMEVHTEPDGSDPSRTIIRVNVATRPPDRQPLPAGLLFVLLFKTDKDAEPGATVPVEVLDFRAMTIENAHEPIAPVFTHNGAIEIKETNPPAVPCFFFSH